mmetsp:Transcript_102425/g.267325  ORF Transcript_102425/g.267325 Transcript_102425/m.267325 type:complete len:302 (-) Transcript_102425:32-937(-)
MSSKPVVIVYVLEQRVLVSLSRGRGLAFGYHLVESLVHQVSTVVGGERQLRGLIYAQPRDNEHHNQYQYNNPPRRKLGELLADPALGLQLQAVLVHLVQPVVVVPGLRACLPGLPALLPLPRIVRHFVQLDDADQPENPAEPGPDLGSARGPRVVNLPVLPRRELGEPILRGLQVHDQGDRRDDIQPEEEAQEVVVLAERTQDDLQGEHGHARDGDGGEDVVIGLLRRHQANVVADEGVDCEEGRGDYECPAVDNPAGDRDVPRPLRLERFPPPEQGRHGLLAPVRVRHVEAVAAPVAAAN